MLALKGIRKFYCVLLSVVMFLSLSFSVMAAEEPEVVRGEAPPLNMATDQYEISTPEHLLYLSGSWKEDTPRDGHYVLMNDIDMAGIEDFLPIAALKKEGFLGTFDGQFHAIYNLKIHYLEKYVGLFGYVGNQDESAYIKNTALIDCDILGKQNVGGMVGVCYGTVTGCIVTGRVEVDRESSNAHTGGGIAGKVKEGEGPIIGHVENCYVDCDVLAPYDVGGIAGIQDGGGYIGKCLARGTVEATSDAHSGGGIVGSFNAGEYLLSNVAMENKISGGINMDLIVGQLDDESGVNITDNLAWEGTILEGNEPREQPNQATYTVVSAAELQNQATYEALEWDFLEAWQWVESADGGYPLPYGFDSGLVAAPAYQLQSPQISYSQLKPVYQGEEAVVSLKVASDVPVESVKLFYGDDENGTTFADSLDMELDGDRYTASLPTDVAKNLYYYVQAVAGGNTATKPYHIENSYLLYVDDGTIKGQPEQITVTVGEKQDEYRFSWVTVPEVTETFVEYQLEGEDEWKKEEGSGDVFYITEGWKEKFGHKAEVSGLPYDTVVTYRVGDGADFFSEPASFKTAPKPEDGFSFLIMADPQSVTVEDYQSFKNSVDYALTVSEPDFLLLPGDITQDGYKSSEWESCFTVMQEFFSTMPVIAVPGNHEMKGDWDFVNFTSRFNMPGGDIGTGFDDTLGVFEVGDACIVAVNTEVTPPAEKPEILRKQMEWAKKCYENSDKKWRIMVTHAGPYTSNHPTEEVKEYLIGAVDEMGVDLFVNGHDHIYIRGTVQNDTKVPIGEGTTYLTAGTVGNKYYSYLEASDVYTDFYCDDEDQQIFSVVTVNSESISGKAYQRSAEDEETEEIDWTDWSVIDEYTIAQPLHVEAEQAAAPGAADEQVAAEKDSSSGFGYLWIVFGVVILAAGGAVLYMRKKKKS